ncbi:zinc finger Y-chromosomal protein 2-like [Chelonus insularis]|uniref:zinc finger Y-chromosomal protein 2-like n=1 Tax=Chelonus insularis TaxID=460826 RepID=UPI00158BAD98|nr:zinc finger Y-chromosomal protein 2-like [Chelonus insularis]
MSREEVVSTFSRSKLIPRLFQCRKGLDIEKYLTIEEEHVDEDDSEYQVTNQRQICTNNYKPKKRTKKNKTRINQVLDLTEDSSKSWGGYCQSINGIYEIPVTNNGNDKSTDTETVEDIEKWLKTRTESISSIEMDPTKCEVDEGVDRYLEAELSHSFLEKDPDGLSIDIDLSDKKLSLGYDPILQELQSEKLLEVCEKDGFILPEFQLDQLDGLPIAPNDMMVAGEILPSTSSQSNLAINSHADIYSDNVKKHSKCLDTDNIGDKSDDVNVYTLPEEFMNSEIKQSSSNENHDNLHDFDEETSKILEEINSVNSTASIIDSEVQNSSIVEEELKEAHKFKPSIMKKCPKVPEEMHNFNNTDEEIQEDCQNDEKNNVMTIVAISTDKRSNMTQIVINTDKGEQIYRGKTSELMEATGYFSKLPKNNITWNNLTTNNDMSPPSSNHEIIISNALEELGYTEDSLVSVILPENRRTWICPREECRKEFNRLYALKSHLLAHHGIRPFKCDYEGCTWAFHSEFKLKRHKETHLKRKDYVCQVPDCNKRFTTVYNLWTHEKLHTRPNRIVCQVPECDEKFQTKRALELHMKTHDQSHAPYVCFHEGCGKRYYSSNALTSHQRCHSYKEVDIKCSWPGCGKIFDKPCRLKAHLRSHTGSKPYLCEFPGCPWAFTSSSKLKRHEKKHTNDRKFVCDVDGCSKAFMRSEHLKEHKLTHTEGRYFQCYLCDARFSAKSSLYVHIKKHQTSKEALDNAAVQSLLDAKLSFGEKDNLEDFYNELPIELEADLTNESSQEILLVKANVESTNDISNDNIGVDHIATPKLKFTCPVDTCLRSYMTKASLRTHMVKCHGERTKQEASLTPQMDYMLFTGEDNAQIPQIAVDSEIANVSLDTSCLPEPKPPPQSSVKKCTVAHSDIDQKVKKNHGAARTGLVYSDIRKMKKNNATLNSIVGPSDVVLGSADLGEGFFLHEELTSMYYEDDMVGTPILLLDSAAPETAMNLRDLE